MMTWLQSGGLLQVGGIVVLVVCVRHMLNERKARVAAQRRALLRSTEQVIQDVLLTKRYSTKQGKE